MNEQQVLDHVFNDWVCVSGCGGVFGLGISVTRGSSIGVNLCPRK